MALILEVLDGRTGEVRAWRRLGDAPLSIGRSYANDIPLDDPYVDAWHARATPDGAGAWVIEDLGSVNALRGSDGRRVRRVVLHAGTVVRLGHTRLRISDADAPLPAALPDEGFAVDAPWMPRWLTTPWGERGAVVAATGIVAWLTWLGTYEHAALETVSVALVFLLVVACWAGIWAAVGRVLTHRSRFRAHLTVASAFLAGALILSTVSEWVSFLFPGSAVSMPIEALVGLLFFVTLLATHLALASTMTRGRRWRAILITVGLMLAAGVAMQLAEGTSFSDVPEYSASLKPFPSTLLPAGSAEDMTTLAARLKRQVDAMASSADQD